MSKSVGGGAFLADRGQDVKKAGILEGRRRYECKLFGCRRIGCQEVKLLSVLRTKITSVTSQPSCPLNFCSSDNDPLPSPHPREGACSCKTNLQSNNCHCERQNGASQSPNLCNINEITTSNASPSPRNDRENLCKTQVSGAAATLPHRGEGISNYNQIIYNNQPSPQPSPTGEEVSNYKMLKQVQHDTNSSKRTYSPIHLFSYSPCKRCAFTLAEVLITLGIIGVVAAMTLPSLIQKYKIQEYVSKLNKFYTVISNAYIMAKNDNGDISGWNLKHYESSSSNEEDFLYYLLPYMNVVKFCGKNEKGCFPDIVYGSIGSAGFRMNLNTNSWYSNAILNDGMYISSLTFSNTCGNAYAACALLRVDVNGDAPPNKMGIDLHTFAVYKDRILPGGLSDVLDDEQSINRGDACTAHVIYEKNMDYIKDGKCEIYE